VDWAQQPIKFYNDYSADRRFFRKNMMSDTTTSKINYGKVDPKLLELLACPLTKSGLRYDEAAGELISDKAGLAFPIRDGIPIMLVEEAREIEKD